MHFEWMMHLKIDMNIINLGCSDLRGFGLKGFGLVRVRCTLMERVAKGIRLPLIYCLYNSDTGADAPESCIFTLVCSVGGILGECIVQQGWPGYSALQDGWQLRALRLQV